jgi:hypothetical protein
VVDARVERVEVNLEPGRWSVFLNLRVDGMRRQPGRGVAARTYAIFILVSASSKAVEFGLADFERECRVEKFTDVVWRFT